MSNLSAPVTPDNGQPSWVQPEGSSFGDWMGSRIARFATRRYRQRLPARSGCSAPGL